MSQLLRDLPERPIGVVRPTIVPDCDHPMFEACCRLCDTVSYPGVISEVETWLLAHLRSKHNREPDQARPVRSGLEDWPLEVKR